MVKSFSFNKINKKFINVELKNGLKLQVTMPSKRTFEALQILMDTQTENTNAVEAYDSLANVVAEALSNNLNNETISKKEVADLYDLEDLVEFTKAFFEYVKEATNSPN